MRINKVSVVSSNLVKTLSFYAIVGFKFPKLKKEDQHIESTKKEDSIQLMIDTQELMKKIFGEIPTPGTGSIFAIEFETPEEINEICKKLKKNNFKIIKEPWDAFWQQRYAVIEDPDGHRLDLYYNY